MFSVFQSAFNLIVFNTVFSILVLLSSKVLMAEEILPEIVVTATRTAQTVDDSLAAVTVITREQIEQSSALTVPDLLRDVVGLETVRNGGIGQASSVFMRGTNSDHVLVLIDGIKIGSATLGQVPFQDLSLSQVERIEVVRGPRSSLYGSEALGGVIQIFTRRPSEQSTVQASVGVGNDNHYETTADVSGAMGKMRYALGTSHLQSDGFDACQANLMSGCFTDEPDDDSYRNTSAHARLTYHLTDWLDLEGHWWRAVGKTDYDSSFQNALDFVHQVLGLKTNITLSDTWDMSFHLGENRDEEDNSGHNTPNSVFNTQRTSFTWQNDWVIGENNLLTVGYDYQNEDVEGSVAYVVNSRDNHGYFAEYQHQFALTNLVLGLRNDDNEQFGNHLTGNIALGYDLTPTLQTFLAYGTAFKAPSFNELYYPDFGNAQLVPEESQNIELGFKGQHKHHHWALSVYHTKIDELISIFPIANIDKAKITGVEGQLGWQIADWVMSVNGTWLTAEDEATGYDLPRRAEKTLGLDIAHTIGSLKMGLKVFVQSQRYDDAMNQHRLGGYGVTDIYSQYAFNPHWTLQAQLENVFDKDYETARFYNMPSRAFFMRLHCEW